MQFHVSRSFAYILSHRKETLQYILFTLHVNQEFYIYRSNIKKAEILFYSLKPIRVLHENRRHDRLTGVMKRLVCMVWLLSLMAGGCHRASSSAEKAAQEGILIVGNNAEPQSLDPHKATAVADGKIISCLLEGLVRGDSADNTRVHPGMATSWEHNENADRWVFHLREARWSDGTPVRASDFVYAWKRMLHPQFGGRYAEMLYPLKNAQEYKQGKKEWEEVGVKTPDEHTLVLQLREPMPNLSLRLLHYTWFPLPAEHIEKHGGMLDRRSEWTRPEHWVGNGAYILTEHRFNDYVEVRANPLYYRAEQVQNKGVRFLPVVNGFTETRMFWNGKLHITNNVPPEIIDSATRHAPEAYCQDPYYCTIFYRLNTLRAPLNDVRVRRALSLAINRDALVRDVVRGAGEAAYGFTPPGVGYATPTLGVPREDAARTAEARRLLAEAGFPNGQGFPSLELMTSSREVQKVTAEAIQAMWQKKLGIHIEIRACEWTAYKAAQQNMQYDISSSSWSGDYLDPATFIDLFQSKGGNNNTGWRSDRYDRLLHAAHSAGKVTERLKNLAEAEGILLNEMPIIPLYQAHRTYLKDPRITGWHALLLDQHPLDAVSVDACTRKESKP